MPDGKIDADSSNTLMGVTNDAALTPQALLIDPVTGGLKVKCVLAAAPAGNSVSQKTDANGNYTLGGWDGTQNRGLKVDPTSGYLLIQF